MNNIFVEVSNIICRVLKLKENSITRDSSAETVHGWDSLSHIALIIAIESFYRIKFKASEIASLKNVGELVDLVEAKLVRV